MLHSILTRIKADKNVVSRKISFCYREFDPEIWVDLEYVRTNNCLGVPFEKVVGSYKIEGRTYPIMVDNCELKTARQIAEQLDKDLYNAIVDFRKILVKFSNNYKKAHHI